MPYISTRRLYLTADGATVVEEGDARAATLLVGVGGQLSDEDATRYHLRPEADAPAVEGKADAEGDDTASPAKRKPANKAVTPTEDK